MTTASFRIAFFADTHLGYAAKCRIHGPSGLNHRVRDGWLALRQTIDQILAAEVDLVVHGGDLFHRSHPMVGDIVWARQQFERLAHAKIPLIGTTGNHDATNERGKLSATAAVHDPARGIEWVTDPYKVIEPVDGLAIHVLSHYALARAERLLPDPKDGVVNILTAHGAAMLPGHDVFRCVDSPGELPIGLDLLMDDRFVLKALGHYHGMGEILPGVWYAGSAIRRGFADPPGGRGWLLCTVYSDGRVEVEPQYIDQRPQYDLPVIDAAGLTGAEVEERIRANLADIDVTDAIIRQVVVNCTTPVRRGINQPALAQLTAPALMWMLDLRRPETPPPGEKRPAAGDALGDSLATAGAANLPAVYENWVPGWAKQHNVAPELVPVVASEGTRHLQEASRDAETGDFAAPPDPTPAAPAQVPQPRPHTPSMPEVDSVTGEVTPW